LTAFERRLHDGRWLTRQEGLGLIAKLRQVRLERQELQTAQEPLQIKVSQHCDTPQPDKWFYEVPETCDGGPCKSAADALRAAMWHVRWRAIAALTRS